MDRPGAVNGVGSGDAIDDADASSASQSLRDPADGAGYHRRSDVEHESDDGDGPLQRSRPCVPASPGVPACSTTPLPDAPAYAPEPPVTVNGCVVDWIVALGVGKQSGKPPTAKSISPLPATVNRAA